MTSLRRSAAHATVFVALIAAGACGGGGAKPADAAADRADVADRDATTHRDVTPDRDQAVDEAGPSDARDVLPTDGLDAAADVPDVAPAAPNDGAPADVTVDAVGPDADRPPAPSGPRWVSLGAPAGGNVTALAVAPDGTVFAGVGPLLPFRIGDGTGLFKSRDSGASWQPSNQGLHNFNVQDIALTNGVLYAATRNLVRSLDGGLTWVQSLISDQEFITVGAGPGGLLAFAADDFNGSLSRTEDGGLNWTSVRIPSASFGINSVVVLGSVVLAHGDSGLSRSTDGGKTFSPVASQAGSTFASFAIPNLLCGGGRCYLSGRSATGGQAFLVSTDDGATWNPIGQPGYFPLALAADGTLYVRSGTGLARSDDGGMTWMTLAVPPATPTVLAVRGKTVFAGTPQGVLRSDDQGASWSPANGSVAEGALTAMTGYLLVDSSSTAVSPNGDLYVGAPDVGLLRSIDDGASWSVVKVGFEPRSCVVNEEAGITCTGSTGSLRTKDHGVSWQPWSVPAFVDQIGGGQWFVAGRGKTIYASGKADLATFGKVARSDDGGLTFQVLAKSPEVSQYIQVLPNGHVLANSMSDTYRSIDRGETWTTLANDLKLPMAVDAAGVFYRAYGEYVQTSIDEGDTWTFLDAHQTLPLGARIGPLWFDVAGNLFTTSVGQGDSERIGVWTMFASNDQGMHWISLPAQLPHPIVSMVAFDKRGRTLAATNGGVYRLQ